MSSLRVRTFEDVMLAQLVGLVRADVPARAIRLTVREAVVARMEGGPLGAREVTDAMEAAVRAACRLVLEMRAPDEVVETVCRAALEAVRGHGGTSARWLPEATSAAHAVLDQLALERPPAPGVASHRVAPLALVGLCEYHTTDIEEDGDERTI